MLGFNGGLIGARRTPTDQQASGMWFQNEQSVAKRAAIWPSTLTGDPFFASVSLLLNMDGSNGSTTFTDLSSEANTVTAYGDAQVSTTAPKFGTGSLLLDGNGDFLAVTSDASLAFGTSDFTIEAWIYANTVDTGAQQIIYSQRGVGGYSLYLLGDGRLSLLSNSLNSIAENSTLIQSQTWTHVAGTRAGTSNKIWVNGVERGEGTWNVENNALTGNPLIGTRADGGGGAFAGKIDELRITIGVARYTANFTPPVLPFPAFL
jgi:hypothetical protein